jgi:hypothetical protein
MKRLLRGLARVPAWTVWVAAVLAIALLARDGFAQEVRAVQPFDLVGTLSDEGGRPLVGAFVSLADSEWGSLTDETGRFRIPDVTPGVVTVRAELLGYEALEWQGAVEGGSALALTMSAKPILLEGLTVVTDRFESRRRSVATSVRWFDHDALATSPQPTALDFVKTRAGLFSVSCNGRWTSRCFMVRGRPTEPRVYVDEMPVFGGMEYLESMAPHELYMVEVYGSGRAIRAYTPRFMERAAEYRLMPMPFVY